MPLLAAVDCGAGTTHASAAWSGVGPGRAPAGTAWGGIAGKPTYERGTIQVDAGPLPPDPVTPLGPGPVWLWQIVLVVVGTESRP